MASCMLVSRNLILRGRAKWSVNLAGGHFETLGFTPLILLQCYCYVRGCEFASCTERDEAGKHKVETAWGSLMRFGFFHQFSQASCFDFVKAQGDQVSLQQLTAFVKYILNWHWHKVYSPCMRVQWDVARSASDAFFIVKLSLFLYLLLSHLFIFSDKWRRTSQINVSPIINKSHLTISHTTQIT